MLVSINIATLYLASYILIVSTTILSLALLKITSVCLSSSITKHPTLLLITAISFINIGGLPPLFGFFIKASVIKALIDSNLIRLLVPLIAGSVLNLYYYLKVVFINTLETPPQSLILKTINHPTQILLPILFSSSTVGAVVTLTLFLI
jgi:NADH:ubiquinone oxidoreductase subunit 2 (subunit N)